MSLPTQAITTFVKQKPHICKSNKYILIEKLIQISQNNVKNKRSDENRFADKHCKQRQKNVFVWSY